MLHLFSALGLAVEWCIIPSTVHVRQDETCKTLVDVASRKIILEAMRGEEEGRQILLDLEPWPADYNLSVSLSLTSGDLVSPKGKIAASVVSWWQVGYVYCKETTRYTPASLVPSPTIKTNDCLQYPILSLDCGAGSKITHL